MSRAVKRRSQIIPELTVGTALPPTSTTPPARQMSGIWTMKDSPERRLRERQRASMYGPNTYDDMAYRSDGSYVGRVVFNEVPFIMAASIRGDVAPTTVTGGQQWVYTQDPEIIALKSYTVYVGDNTHALRSAGVFISRWEIAGADTDWWRLNATALGREQVNDLDFNTALVTPVAEGPKNKKTILSIDEPGGTIGATIKQNTGYTFRCVFDAGIEPDYAWTTGGLDMSDIQRDIPEVTLEITTKWDATALAEFGKRKTQITRLIRLENSGSVLGAGNYRLRIDGAWQYTDFEPLAEARDGTQLGRLILAAVDDATYGKKFEVAVLCDTTAAELPVA